MKILQYIADLLMPRLCPVCKRPLNADEKYVCAMCMAELPRTGYHAVEFNAMEQLFAGKVPIERAAGYFYYERGSRHAAILHAIKYHNQPEMGEWMARQFACEIKTSGFFDGIDAIVPVPLHRSKLAQRGYNQCEYIARGMASVAGCPVKKLLKAVKGHETQTHKGQHERLLNIEGVFGTVAELDRYADSHLLLIDDVVTTGATLISCAELLKYATSGRVRISIATLAVARLQ